MSIHNYLTLFTNEPERNLYDRFNKILKSNTKFFDILVGYFRTSGFHLMYPAVEDVERIRGLVGLDVDYKIMLFECLRVSSNWLKVYLSIRPFFYSFKFIY